MIDFSDAVGLLISKSHQYGPQKGPLCRQAWFNSAPKGGGCQGYFAETYRSSEALQVEGSEGNDRSIFTTIYYLMAPELGGMNFLHSNKSDTVHYFHDGWPAKYVLVSPSEGKVKEYILGRDVTKGHVPQLLVPGGFLKAGKILVKVEELSIFSR